MCVSIGYDKRRRLNVNGRCEQALLVSSHLTRSKYLFCVFCNSFYTFEYHVMRWGGGTNIQLGICCGKHMTKQLVNFRCVVHGFIWFYCCSFNIARPGSSVVRMNAMSAPLHWHKAYARRPCEQPIPLRSLFIQTTSQHGKRQLKQ